MRILHVLDHSLPLHAGYAFRTAAILREQRALGWQTMQLTTPRNNVCDAPYEDVDGVRYHRTAVPDIHVPLPGARYAEEMAATARRLEELVAEFRPDVLQPHSPVLDALPAMRVARRHGLPVVYELRSSWEDAAVDHGTTREGSPRYRLARALETWVLRRVDHVTTICDGLRSEVIARGIPPERVTVIPNAVDVDAFRFDATPDEALRRRLGLAGMDVIGFCGSFYAYEGLDLLVDAFARLAPGRPRMRLLLVGGGFQEAALRAQVALHGLEERVVFAGRVHQDQVQRYYGLIDLLAYPRHRMRLTELVTPLKPLEAMAQGRMFVASDVGGHQELVRDGETGFLFPAGDAAALAATIERVLASRDRWGDVLQNARRFVESERTWARSVARYADVYDAVLRNTARAPAADALPGD